MTTLRTLDRNTWIHITVQTNDYIQNTIEKKMQRNTENTVIIII